jgi:hypothetical protein
MKRSKIYSFSSNKDYNLSPMNELIVAGFM